MSAYRDLERRFQRISALGQAAGMLHWDMAVLMPRGGAAARAEQLAALRLTCHEMLTDPALADLLAAAEFETGLDDWQRANLREMRREWTHATALPGRLVEALSKARNACEMRWREARPAKDFAQVAPHLAELLALTREAAAATAEKIGTSPYEALLDRFEPGARTERIDRLFDDLATFLPGFLPRVLERQAQLGQPRAPRGPFAIAAQRALGERLMRTLGFDFENGRLDVSLHPFCGGVPEDVRITTRFADDDFAQSLMAVLHETGHALYEKGLPTAWRNQPVGEARGMALHESQSLIIEMQACRSREFLGYAAPLMRDAFAADGPEWHADNLYRMATRVERGLIRVDADEVTYPAHVILRYRLERALLAGDLAIADLPAAWNEGMRALLGIVPPDDGVGVLQDIHWYDGAFGYFPTYTMGALAAAQLFAAARRAEPGIPAAIGRGDFSPLIAWLRVNVHQKGARLFTDELLVEATGAALGTETFKRHLERRYLEG